MLDQLNILEDRQSVMDGDSDSAQVNPYYSDNRLKDPNVKKLVDLMNEFEAIQGIEEDPAIVITVNTEEEWKSILF